MKIIISCSLSIEKKFSEGGDARRYFNDSAVKILDDPLKKIIDIDGANFQIRLDTSSQYIQTVSAKFSEDKWEMSWDAKYGYGLIKINRITGGIYGDSFFTDASGWMRTAISGVCKKIEQTRKF